MWNLWTSHHVYAVLVESSFIHSVKKACFKTLVDEVQELEALSKDPGAVVHGKRYVYTQFHHSCQYTLKLD